MAMAASVHYKSRLSQWIDQEVQRWGSSSKLAARLGYASNTDISGEQVRKWSKGQFVKQLDTDMLAILAAYRGETLEQTRQWLEGGSLDVAANPVTRRQIEAIDNPLHLIEIQIWIAERLRNLLNQQALPQSAEELALWLTANFDYAIERSELPLDRIEKLSKGDLPTAEEMIKLSRCWNGDTSWLINLFETDATVQSAPTPKKRRSTKARSV